MGGLWVDYELMTTIPGLFAIGEANFADHGANRLGANSLLQACVDGYFILPYTLANYLSGELKNEKITTDHPDFEHIEKGVVEQLTALCKIKGTKTADYFHKRLGKLLYDKCGLSRSRAGLTEAIEGIKVLKAEFYKDLIVPGTTAEINAELEKAGRVADYLEIAELMCNDALSREDHAGAFEEYQMRTVRLEDDDNYCYVSAWEWIGNGMLLCCILNH